MVPISEWGADTLTEKLREILQLIDNGRLEEAYEMLEQVKLRELTFLDPATLILFLSLLLEELIKYV
ncbi:MAG: hypothetical protein GXO26_04365 [Crenarchaeota archaeon]|nr:hypothetical protein [Thermoproteota archaeon]